MLKNQRNLQPAPRLQWADCHIPHIDTLHPATRSLSERRALPANSGKGQPPAASLLRPPAPLARRSLSPFVPLSLCPCLFVPGLSTPLPSNGNHHPAIGNISSPSSPAPRPPLHRAQPAPAMCALSARIAMNPLDIAVLFSGGEQPRPTLSPGGQRKDGALGGDNWISAGGRPRQSSFARRRDGPGTSPA
jgi:hypothetical protein